MLDAGTPMQNSKCTAQGWTTVFSEKAGTGNGAQYDNSDIRTLNLVKPPFDVKKGNYRVRMEWGNGGWAEFTVSIQIGEKLQSENFCFIQLFHVDFFRSKAT